MKLHCAALILLSVGAAELSAQTGQATFGTVIPLAGSPSDIIVDESRGRLYLINSAANRVEIYDYRQKRLTGYIGVGTFPLSAAMSMDNRLLYVTNTQSATLSVIDLATDGVLQTVSLPTRPEGVAVGRDGRVLITTQGSGPTNAQNTLLIFDSTQQQFQQVYAVPSPPPISTPNPLPQVFVGRPATPFPGRLIRTPDGEFIIGMVAINQTTTSAQTTLFVYEVASGTVLRNRTVTGQSTVLALSPDGSRFMAGSTLYDTGTLGVLAQMNTANLPFFIGAGFNPGFNIQRNLGGSVFSPDGETVYGAFNTAATALRPEARALLVADSRHLGVNLGIRLPETILGNLVATADGNNVWAISESGIMHLPLGELYEHPILMPDTNTVFLAVDPCNKGIAKTVVRVNNAGKGKLTFSVPNVTTALVTQVSTGVAPASVTFIMEPGRSGVVRQPGTNLFTGAGGGGGSPINLTISSLEAINFPNTIRVYMNFRESDQHGIIHPVPVVLSNAERLHELLLDEPRGKLYMTNSGFNRVEVFDIHRQRLLAPIQVGQLPRTMAMTPDRNTLYVGNAGGESISIVDLNIGKTVGQVEFPPIPRAGNQGAIAPVAMAAGLFNLQFIMSNGGQWQLIGNQALPRPASAITPATFGAPRYMVATPEGDYIFTLSGNNNASGYLYDALINNYISGRQLYNQPPVSYFGPVGAAKERGFLLANGLILSPSLAIVGGAEQPGAVRITPPAQPGQQPQTTIVSAGQRNVSAVAPVDAFRFVRLTTPVRQNITVVTRDDPRPTLELVDVRTGAESLVAVAPDTPQTQIFGSARSNVPGQQMVVDSKNNVYAITLSGLSVIPLTLRGAPERPRFTGGARAIVNSADGSTSFRP